MKDTSPRQYALVKLKPEYKKWLNNNGNEEHQLLKEDVFVFLGEIPNMPDHCIVAGHMSGKLFSGLHVFDFIELLDEEI